MEVKSISLDTFYRMYGVPNVTEVRWLAPEAGEVGYVPERRLQWGEAMRDK